MVIRVYVDYLLIVGESALVNKEVKMISEKYGVRVKAYVDEYIVHLCDRSNDVSAF